MLKVSKLLDYSLLIVVKIANNEKQSFSAPKISEQIGLNLPTVRKILNLLVINNIVSSKRGIEGGYILSKDSSQIMMLDIVKAVSGDVNITECCNLQNNSCLLAKCNLQDYWKGLNDKINELMANTSLKEIIESRKEDK